MLCIERCFVARSTGPWCGLCINSNSKSKVSVNFEESGGSGEKGGRRGGRRGGKGGSVIGRLDGWEGG